MGAPRLRRVSTTKEMDTIIDDFVTQGYSILERGEHSALLRKNTWGSGGIHVVLFITTWALLWIPNIAYAVLAHFVLAEKVFIKIQDGSGS